MNSCSYQWLPFFIAFEFLHTLLGVLMLPGKCGWVVPSDGRFEGIISRENAQEVPKNVYKGFESFLK